MIVKKIICNRRISETTHHHHKPHKNIKFLIQNLRNKEKHDNNHNEKQLNN